MTVREKALGAIFAIWLLLFLAFGLSYHWAILREADQADREGLEKDLTRIRMTLDQELRELVRLARDWANWDATYDFASNGTVDFLDSSLTPNKMAHTIQVDHVAVVDQFGHVKAALSLMPGTARLIPSPEAIHRLFVPQGPLFPPNVPDGGRGVFMWLHGSPALAAACPVRDSTEAMPRTGLFFVARLLEGRRLEDLKKLTQLDIRILPPDGMPSHLRFDPDADHPTGRIILDRTAQEGYVMMRGINDQGTFWVAIRAPRVNYVRAMGNMMNTGALMFLMGILVALVLTWLLDRLVLNRLERLHREIGNLRFYSEDRVSEDGHDDEITSLARSINQALAALRDNHLRREEAEMSARLAHVELLEAYERTIEGWSLAMDLRDKETEGHTRRVTDLTMALAERLEYKEGLIHLRRGALLHDIGKLGVPDAILLKPGPLTDEEWEIMRQHPIYAYNMLTPIQYLHPAIPIPYCHHERWDGTGYPQGLKGTQIPLSARIFAVVDIWDALTSDRPYRKAWDRRRTLDHIDSLRGTHLDPDVAKAFLEMMDKA